MLENDFLNWLLKKYNEKTAASRKTNCLTVCRYEEDLDIHFEKDNCRTILSKLTYSTDDERHNRQAKHKIPINGNIRKGTATLKQAVKLYIQFRMDIKNGNNEVDKPRKKEKIDYSSKEKIKSNWPVSKRRSDSHANREEMKMAAKYKILQKENIENNPDFLEIKRLAKEIFDFINLPDISKKISNTHKINVKSGEIQDILLEKMNELGFKSEKTGLFSNYKTSALRPDYYKKLGQNKGIIIEVERGKTLANNMDMLDIWKCHICEEANYLFLIVPQIRPTEKGTDTIIYDKVIDRLKSFFKKSNYLNIDAVVIFGY